MKRREFVLYGTAALAAIPGLIGCGSDNNGGSVNGTGGYTGGTGGSTGGSGGSGGSTGGTGGATGGTGGATGGTGGATGGTGGTSACTQDINATSTIVLDHDHTVTIPLSDILAASPGTFTFSTVGGHNHTIDLTADDMNTLSGGGSVTKTSTEGSGAFGPHHHDVTLTCS